MVTEATPTTEEVTPQAAPEAGTPLSTDTLVTLPETGEVVSLSAPGAGAEETPETEAPEGDISSPPTLEALEAKAEREGLTPDEGKQLKQLRADHERDAQAEADRQRAYQAWAAKDRAEQEAAVQRLASLKDETLTRMREARTREIDRANERGVDPDWQFIAEREQAEFDAYAAQARNVALQPEAVALRESILKMAGETPQNRQAVNAMDFGQLMQSAVDMAFKQGMTTPVDGWVRLSQKDFDERIKTERETAVSDYQKALRKKGVGETSRANGVVTSGGGRSYTLNEIDKMPTSEWLRIPSDQRKQILEDAKRQAGAR